MFWCHGYCREPEDADLPPKEIVTSHALDSFDCLKFLPLVRYLALTSVLLFINRQPPGKLDVPELNGVALPGSCFLLAGMVSLSLAGADSFASCRSPEQGAGYPRPALPPLPTKSIL